MELGPMISGSNSLDHSTNGIIKIQYRTYVNTQQNKHCGKKIVP